MVHDWQGERRSVFSSGGFFFNCIFNFVVAVEGLAAFRPRFASDCFLSLLVGEWGKESGGKGTALFRGNLGRVIYSISLSRQVLRAWLRNFIVHLEEAIPDFYEQVGQHLKAWQPQAPKIKEDRAEPADVGTAAMQLEAEQVVTERNAPEDEIPAEV